VKSAGTGTGLREVDSKRHQHIPSLTLKLYR